jgi:hypothetical protein
MKENWEVLLGIDQKILMFIKTVMGIMDLKTGIFSKKI